MEIREFSIQEGCQEVGGEGGFFCEKNREGAAVLEWILKGANEGDPSKVLHSHFGIVSVFLPYTYNTHTYTGTAASFFTTSPI
jgi:hypothetical protein